MSKPYLIMLPGWGMDSFIWEKVNKPLSEQFELIFIEWNSVQTLDEFKNLVINTIKEKQLASFSLLGWSLGSLVAQDIVVNNSFNVDRLILTGATSCFIQHKEDGYNSGWNKRIIERMKFQINSDKEKTLIGFNKAMFSKSEKVKKLDAQFLEVSINKVKNKSLDNLILGLDYLIVMDLRDKLTAIDVPLLIIHGEEDSICPLDAALYIKDRVHNSRLEMMSRAGHAPFFTQPDDFCNRIFQFIRKDICKKGRE